ncbi:MAG: hypothetical protein R3F49_05240 [Planctomycetota bacterium]
MSDIAKYVAYGLGGSTLLAGSFFLVAALTGTPLHSLKAVGGLFPPEPKAEQGASDELPEIEEQLEGDTRSPEQIFDAARSSLTAFNLQDPFSAQELSSIENRLLMKMEELDRRSRSLDEREALLERDADFLDRRLKEFERLKMQLLAESDEQSAKVQEIDANREALAAREAQIYKNMAPQYEDGEPDVTAAQLMNVYEPEEAAKVLKHLSDERVRELLSAIHASPGGPEKHKAYSRAYALEKGG